MKQGLTEIICVIDKSGSMDAVKMDAIGAFNSFIEEQLKLPGEAKLTLTLFDTEYKMVYNGVALKDVPKLDTTTFVPGGMTALLDAMGRTIDKVGERLSITPEPERPERVIMVILTDGQENSSKEYNGAKVLEKVKHQQEAYKWEFIYLGANQDAIKAASCLGINNSANYVGTGAGTKGAVRCMNAAVASYRCGGSARVVTPPQA